MLINFYKILLYVFYTNTYINIILILNFLAQFIREYKKILQTFLILGHSKRQLHKGAEPESL